MITGLVGLGSAVASIVCSVGGLMFMAVLFAALSAFLTVVYIWG